MKLSSIQVDSALAEQGDWIENIPKLQGVRIKARGTNNTDYRILESKLVREIPETERAEGVGPVDMDRIASTLLLETVVLDVEGLTEEDGITPIKYTKELGRELLFNPDFKAFHEACAWAGAAVARRKKAASAGETKN